jgi:hypothetical protein
VSLMPEIRTDSGTADFAVLAPDKSESSDGAWLEHAVGAIAGNTHPNAVVYVLAPVRCRFRIARMLRNHGFAYRRSVLHLPSVAASRYMVETNNSSMMYLIGEATAARAYGRLATRVAGVPAMLCAVVPALNAAGLVFTRSGSGVRPAIAAFESVAAAVRTSWRGHRGAATVQLFGPRSGAPLCVGKMRLQQSEYRRTLEEAECLRHAAGTLQTSSARVPEVLTIGGTENFPVLYESALQGTSAARILQQSPSQVAELCKRIGLWLGEWNRATAAPGTLSREVLEQYIFHPAQCLMPELTAGQSYVEWLTLLCSGLADRSFVFAAAHHDLTMRNVLVAGDGTLGIIDWEEYREFALPFTDLFYAVSDAIAASEGYRDRAATIGEAFTHEGRYARWVRPLIAAAAETTGAARGAAVLAFHACWLQHAFNERESGAAERPFLRVLEAVVSRRDEIRKYLDREL